MNTQDQYPSNEKMAEELESNGWSQKRRGIWLSPGGAIYLGPFQAWKAMNGILMREGPFGDAR